MLNGYKTYIVSLGAFLVALGVAIQAFANGQPIEWNLIMDALIALAMIFLRQGIKEKA